MGEKTQGSELYFFVPVTKLGVWVPSFRFESGHFVAVLPQAGGSDSLCLSLGIGKEQTVRLVFVKTFFRSGVGRLWPTGHI